MIFQIIAINGHVDTSFNNRICLVAILKSYFGYWLQFDYFFIFRKYCHITCNYRIASKCFTSTINPACKFVSVFLWISGHALIFQIIASNGHVDTDIYIRICLVAIFKSYFGNWLWFDYFFVFRKYCHITCDYCIASKCFTITINPACKFVAVFLWISGHALVFQIITINGHVDTSLNNRICLVAIFKGYFGYWLRFDYFFIFRKYCHITCNYCVTSKCFTITINPARKFISVFLWISGHALIFQIITIN